MRLIKRPLVVVVRSAYWIPVGLLLHPFLDALAVVRDSVSVLVRHSTTIR